MVLQMVNLVNQLDYNIKHQKLLNLQLLKRGKLQDMVKDPRLKKSSGLKKQNLLEDTQRMLSLKMYLMKNSVHMDLISLK